MNNSTKVTDVETMIDETKNRIKNLKKELAIAEHREKYLTEVFRKKDRSNSIIFNSETNITNNYSKK